MPDGHHEPRRAAGRLRGASMIIALVLAALLGGGTAAAVPPPPPNPSDSELKVGRQAARSKAAKVGELTNELAQAESRLDELRAEVEIKMEEANKALVDLQAAEEAASTAERNARAARAASDSAAATVEKTRTQLDRFVAGSYQQGSMIGSISAYLGSDSPQDLLARSQLLDAVSGSNLDALERMRRARTEQANKDAAARKALEVARQKEAEAEQARAAAEAARQAAVQARQAQSARASSLEAEKSRVEQRLYAAQSRVEGLEGQRQRYNQWLRQKRAEEAERARQAAMASSSSSAGGSRAPAQRPSAPAGATVESVVARAMSQLGVIYAWGGGNASGPTRGIRDGGVADAHGDYMKIGFDCSGLMIYAFAGVKRLPHYSGYQYHSGRKVPLSQMRRGDMLFWGRGRIHHVALYLGNGQMIEAPHSGARVRISPVRYGGIMPYATRLIG